MDEALALTVGRADLTLSKRSLIVLSHAIEGAMSVSARGLVFASFQRREYFEAEARRYASMASAGTTVIVTYSGATGPVPPGVTAVPVETDDPLSRIWALAVFDGDLGLALVARDQIQVLEGGRTLEHARSFAAHWTFRRAEAVAESVRLLRMLGDRLPAEIEARVVSVLDRAAAAPVSREAERLARVTEFLVESIEDAQLRADVAGARLVHCQDNAEIDDLTGLHNRRYLERFLHPSPVGGAMPLCFLLVDVDELKEVNDRLGHAAGDAVLRRVASAIRSASRPGDAVVRWGGDEFVVLMPGVDGPTGHVIGERVVATVQATVMDAPWSRERLSVSVGVTVADDRRLPLESLDAALYAAKSAGKGRSAG